MSVTVLEKTELNEAIEAALAGKFESVARMSDVEAKFKEMAAKVEEPAGALGGLTKTEVWGIPIGQVAVGTFGGVFISELVDGFLARQSTMVKGLAKLGMAGVAGTWGRRWMGKEASFAIALVLGVFGLSQILPIDKWAAQLAGSAKGILPGTIKVTGMSGGAVNQAQRVVDYYSAAEARR